MKTHSKEDFLKRIEETNELFKNSTDAVKRVMIAQDCIERILSGFLKPKCGRVIVLPDNGSLQLPIVNRQSVNTELCQVCAKGGLFASYIGRVNNFESTDRITNESDNDAHKKLLEIFDLNQLAIIEFAFEGSQFIGSHINGETFDKVRSFYISYNDDNERLIAICENIIANEGTFKL